MVIGIPIPSLSFTDDVNRQNPLIKKYLIWFLVTGHSIWLQNVLTFQYETV